MSIDCDHPIDARETTSNVRFTSRSGGYKYTQIYLVCKRCGAYRCLLGKDGRVNHAWDPPDADNEEEEEDS